MNKAKENWALGSGVSGRQGWAVEQEVPVVSWFSGVQLRADCSAFQHLLVLEDGPNLGTCGEQRRPAIKFDQFRLVSILSRLFIRGTNSSANHL